MKITICAYDGHGYFGGPLEWLKRLGPALRELGIAVDFLFITDHAPRLCGTYTRLKESGFHCRALRRHSLTQFRDSTEARVRWILRHLRNDPPDLFVPNLSVPGCFAGRWAQEAGIPAVCVIHSCDAFYAGMTEAFLQIRGPFRLRGAVCVSEMFETSIHGLCQDEVIAARIPCGAPVPRQKVSWDPESFRLAYVGGLRERAKRITDLARAFCRATAEIDGIEAVLFGDGPRREAVERIIRERDDKGRVTVAGKIDSGRIQRELLSCHVIVLLSDFEGLPIALMEAMACGVVPVCLDVESGIRELVKHEKTGLLVKDRGNDFVAAIRRLRYDPDLWQRLSHSARGLIEARYSMRLVARQWHDLVQALATPPERRRLIRVPRRLSLPPVHPSLRGDDRRWGSCGAYVARQVGRIARRCRRGKHSARTH